MAIAWYKKTIANLQVSTVINDVDYSEGVAGPNNSVVYSDKLELGKDVLVNPNVANKYISIFAIGNASSNVKVQLYGGFKGDNVKYLLADNLITNLGTTPAYAKLDIAQYPAEYYYIGLQSPDNHSAKTYKVKVIS